MREGWLIKTIREAIQQKLLAEPFTPAEGNQAVGITYAGNFLPKHRVGNPGHKGRPNSELFIQVSHAPVTYRLR